MDHHRWACRLSLVDSEADRLTSSRRHWDARRLATLLAAKSLETRARQAALSLMRLFEAAADCVEAAEAATLVAAVQILRFSSSRPAAWLAARPETPSETPSETTTVIDHAAAEAEAESLERPLKKTKQRLHWCFAASVEAL